jgi:hypothetical protein
MALIEGGNIIFHITVLMAALYVLFVVISAVL